MYYWCFDLKKNEKTCNIEEEFKKCHKEKVVMVIKEEDHPKNAKKSLKIPKKTKIGRKKVKNGEN